MFDLDAMEAADHRLAQICGATTAAAPRRQAQTSAPGPEPKATGGCPHLAALERGTA